MRRATHFATVARSGVLGVGRSIAHRLITANACRFAAALSSRSQLCDTAVAARSQSRAFFATTGARLCVTAAKKVASKEDAANGFQFSIDEDDKPWPTLLDPPSMQDLATDKVTFVTLENGCFEAYHCTVIG